MTTVVGIRGSNGSGKTTVARWVMEAADDTFKKKAKLSNGVLVNVYEDFVVIGSYDRACGGCDTISKPQMVWDAIVEAAEHTNVLFEGVIVGNVYEPTIALAARLKEIDARYVPICLDTSLEQCIANVNARRAKEGKPPIEKEDNIVTNYKKHLSSAKKLHAAGFHPHWVDAKTAAKIAFMEVVHDQVF